MRKLQFTFLLGASAGLLGVAPTLWGAGMPRDCLPGALAAAAWVGAWWAVAPLPRLFAGVWLTCAAAWGLWGHVDGPGLAALLLLPVGAALGWKTTALGLLVLAMLTLHPLSASLAAALCVTHLLAFGNCPARVVWLCLVLTGLLLLTTSLATCLLSSGCGGNLG